MQARLADGRVLEFEDGTPPEVIDRIVKENLAGGLPAPPKNPKVEAAEQARAKLPAVARYADTALRGFARGANPFMDDTAAVMDTVTGQGEGEGFGERYKSNLAAERSVNAVDDRDRSLLSHGAQIAGAVASPMGRMALGAKGATLPGRIARGAAVGGGYGAAYGAGAGDDLKDRGERALFSGTVGAGLGAAIPPVVDALKWMVRPVAQAARGFANPEKEAARRVFNTIDKAQQEGRGPSAQELAMARQADSPLVLGDMAGEPGRALARSAANSSPEGREALAEVTQERFAGQSGRAAQFIGNLVGKIEPARMTEWLRARARTSNAPLYAAADREAAAATSSMPDGLWTPELQHLAQAPAVAKAMLASVPRGADRTVAQGGKPSKAPFLADKEGNLTLAPADASGQRALPTLQYWDNVKRELDANIIALTQAGDRAGASTLRDLRKQLLGVLDNVAPSYAKARASAASFFKAEDALEAGQNFVGMVRSADLAGARRALANMNTTERALFAQGYAAELTAKINQVGDNANVPVRTFFNNPLARQKIEMAFGPKRAAELEMFLTVERTMDRLRTAVSGNSTTARQLVESGLAGALSGGAVTVLLDMAAGGVVGAGTFVTRFLSQIIDKRVAQNVGELLASNDPAKIQRAYSIINATPSARQAFHKLDDALIKIGGTVAGGEAKVEK